MFTSHLDSGVYMKVLRPSLSLSFLFFYSTSWILHQKRYSDHWLYFAVLSDEFFKHRFNLLVVILGSVPSYLLVLNLVWDMDSVLYNCRVVFVCLWLKLKFVFIWKGLLVSVSKYCWKLFLWYFIGSFMNAMFQMVDIFVILNFLYFNWISLL